MFIYSIMHVYKMLILHVEVLGNLDNPYNYQHKACDLILVIIDIILAHLYTHRNSYESIIAVVVLVLPQVFGNGAHG